MRGTTTAAEVLAAGTRHVGTSGITGTWATLEEERPAIYAVITSWFRCSTFVRLPTFDTLLFILKWTLTSALVTARAVSTRGVEVAWATCLVLSPDIPAFDYSAPFRRPPWRKCRWRFSRGGWCTCGPRGR